MCSTLDHIVAGQDALRAADWQRARTCFEAALRAGDDPEAHDGLGLALWWLNDVEAAHRHRESAYLGFKRRGEPRRAAVIAAWLAREQVFLHGNPSAMQGWLARAERLLQEHGPCREYGWFAILRASMVAAPPDLERVAQEVIAVARACDDADLEAFALAYQGMACVSQGRVGDGMQHLDEAMAAATGGEVGSFMVISEIFCVLLSACELSCDLVRTERWCNMAADFARRHACPFLSAYCRTTYGGLLTATGRWHDAEVALVQAIGAFDAGHRGLRVHAVLKLADLRVCQGRLEEAEALLQGYEDHGTAVVPRARLHLARGEPALARAVLELTFRPDEPPALDHAPVLLLLLDVLLALDNVDAARRVVERLTALASRVQSDLLQAQAALAAGKVQRQAGDAGAVRSIQAALDRLRAYEQSLLAGRARLEMARLLQSTDWAGAVTWARAALASFERIGAAHDADEATQVLRRLGVAARSGPRLQGTLTQREAEVLALLARGLSNREIADRLYISPKTAEHHVGQILGKLGARSRAEAVAFAVKGDVSETGIHLGGRSSG